MGAIVSDFPGLPQDADPRRAQLYQGVYDDLTVLGLPLPAQAANVVTRAQLLAHLQAQSGAIIKNELATDPDGLGYGAATDAQCAQLINAPYVLSQSRRFPGASATGYQAAAGSTAAGLVVVLNPGLGNPLLLSLSGLVGAGAIRFRPSATVIPNRGVVIPIQIVSTDTTLTLTTPLPVIPGVGDIFDLGLIVPPQQSARISQILRRFSHSPNAMTTADITAAKV